MTLQNSVTLPMLTFDLTAGRLCLDFANTMEDRLQAQPRDLLGSYAYLLAWSVQARLMSEDQAQPLLDRASQYPEDARAVLERAIELREIIYRIFSALLAGERPATHDLTSFNALLGDAMSHTSLMMQEVGFVWDWQKPDSALDFPLWPVIRSMADILTSDELSMVRGCAAEDCAWLFIDTSKNQTRRWCNMKICGNRSKARRHQERKRQEAQVTDA